MALIRTVDVEEFSTLLYFHYKARYDFYKSLNNTSDLDLKDKWIALYNDHSYISETGYKTFSEEKWKQIRAVIKDKYPKIEPKKDYRLLVDYMSEGALENLRKYGLKRRNGKSIYRYEHMVPKKEYIEKKIQMMALNDELNLEKIKELITKYYYVALILVDEDKRLSKNHMPKDWDGENIFSRYKEAGINLVSNPLYKDLEVDLDTK